jgi:hypothetical protein
LDPVIFSVISRIVSQNWSSHNYLPSAGTHNFSIYQKFTSLSIVTTLLLQSAFPRVVTVVALSQTPPLCAGGLLPPQFVDAPLTWTVCFYGVYVRYPILLVSFYCVTPGSSIVLRINRLTRSFGLGVYVSYFILLVSFYCVTPRSSIVLRINRLTRSFGLGVYY